MGSPPGSAGSPTYYNTPPPTPPEVKRERARKAIVIKTAQHNLSYFDKDDAFIIELLSALNKFNPHKQYMVSNALCNACDDLKIEEKAARSKLRSILLEDVFSDSSALYSALNTQSSLIPISIFGKQSTVSLNYAQSLQRIQYAAKQNDSKAQAMDIINSFNAHVGYLFIPGNTRKENCAKLAAIVISCNDSTLTQSAVLSLSKTLTQYNISASTCLAIASALKTIAEKSRPKKPNLPQLIKAYIAHHSASSHLALYKDETRVSQEELLKLLADDADGKEYFGVEHSSSRLTI